MELMLSSESVNKVMWVDSAVPFLTCGAGFSRLCSPWSFGMTSVTIKIQGEALLLLF